MSGWNSAAVSSYTAEASSLSANVTYEITITSTSVNIGPSGAKGITNLENDFMELSGLVMHGNNAGFDFSNQMGSKAGKDIDHVRITIEGGTGRVVTEIITKHPEKYYFEEIRNYW